MIVCKECGERNEDGTTFCGRCGSFLEFEGERVTEEVPAEATANAQADAPSATTTAQTDVQSGTASGGKTDLPSDSAGVQTDAGSDKADPAARQPGEARARPRGPAPRRVDTLPSGSLVCGQCGTGNDPARRFCLRCGNALAGAAVVTRPPFWRRVLFRERTYVAGTRRRTRRGGRVVFRLVLLVVLVAIVVLLVGPLRPTIVGAYQSIAGTVNGPQQVRPAAVTASASAPGHDAALAFDGASNTYWAAPPGATAPSLRASFTDATDVVAVGITPGVSLKTPEYLAGPRATVVEISATTANGPVAQRFPLPPDPGFRKLTVDLPGVREVTVTVITGVGASKTASGAITEVELYAKS